MGLCVAEMSYQELGVTITSNVTQPLGKRALFTVDGGDGCLSWRYADDMNEDGAEGIDGLFFVLVWIRAKTKD